jgi:uridine monophosphate synthetase
MDKATLINELYQMQLIRFGNFSLKSQIDSPIYIDLRPIVSYPSMLKKIASALWTKAKLCKFDLICGVPYTAIPFATAISLAHQIPMIFKRKEAKDYGTKQMIEGVFSPNQSCLLIEDVITSGKSIEETLLTLHSKEIQVRDILVIIDREQGGKKRLESKGYKLHTLITMTEILEQLQQSQQITFNIYSRIQESIYEHQMPNDN